MLDYIQVIKGLRNQKCRQKLHDFLEFFHFKTKNQTFSYQGILSENISYQANIPGIITFSPKLKSNVKSHRSLLWCPWKRNSTYRNSNFNNQRYLRWKAYSQTSTYVCIWKFGRNKCQQTFCRRKFKSTFLPPSKTTKALRASAQRY